MSLFLVVNDDIEESHIQDGGFSDHPDCPANDRCKPE